MVWHKGSTDDFVQSHPGLISAALGWVPMVTRWEICCHPYCFAIVEVGSMLDPSPDEKLRLVISLASVKYQIRRERPVNLQYMFYRNSSMFVDKRVLLSCPRFIHHWTNGPQ